MVNEVALYEYGMKERGFSIGCQPKNGLVDWIDCKKGDKYYSIIWYDRKLTAQEVREYELEEIND